jgi:gas vesicle protein GvpL/GvpF
VSLLLYAIADADPGAVDGSGIGDAPLSAVGTLGLVAVVGDQPVPAAAEDTLWEYEHAIERLMSRHAVLPARFGSALRDRSAARTLLTRRRHQLLEALSLVNGAVELGVRVTWRASGDARGESGTAYMYGRLAQLHRAREIAGFLGPLADLARATVIRVVPRPGLAVLGAYLVERSLLDVFAERVEQLDKALSDVETACTGPWPAYSFTDAVPSAHGNEPATQRGESALPRGAAR